MTECALLYFSNASSRLSFPYEIPTELVTELIRLLRRVPAGITRYQFTGSGARVEDKIPAP